MKQVFFNSAETGSPQTAEWHAWRRNGIGGSDAPVIAAAHGLVEKAPWMRSLQALFDEKTSAEPKEIKSNPAMRRGINGEAAARRSFETKTGIIVSPIFGEMDEDNSIRSSFDGMSFDTDVLVEIKCPSQKVHQMAVEGKVVGYYQPQIAHQAMVAWGHPSGWRPEKRIAFYSHIPETGEGALVDMPATDLAPLAEALLPHEIAFWKSVQEKRRPVVGDAEFEQAAIEWARLMNEADAIEASLKEARKRLTDALGARSRAEAHGVVAVRSTTKGRVDYAGLLSYLNVTEDVVEKFRGSPSETVTVRREKAK